MARKKKTKKLPKKKIIAGGQAAKRGSLKAHQDRAVKETRTAHRI